MRASAASAAAAAAASAQLQPRVAVVGGGFAGLGAARELADRGVDVVLVEAGRGLGGRCCSRRATVGGASIAFDHGAQYLNPKSPAFAGALAEVEAAGALARWGADGSIGEAPSTVGGAIDLGAFKGYDPSAKPMWVGTPTMSAVGRALAAAAGPRLTALTGARAAALERGPGGGWRLRLEARGGAAADPADVASGEFLAVVTAMSANSTRRLLTGVVDAAAEEAARIQANVCWSLMVALARPLGLPFNGALITAPGAQPHAASGGGGGGGGGGGSRAAGVPEARPCAVSWVARDSSKPGRKLPPGCAETWVVHASPDWSNARGAGADRAAVAEELLAEFLAAVGQASPGDGVLYLEAHPWSNAYPLNPRPPQPVPGLPDCRGAFVLDKGARLAAAGDWALGPRAGDAWDSGREAARAVAELLL